MIHEIVAAHPEVTPVAFDVNSKVIQPEVLSCVALTSPGLKPAPPENGPKESAAVESPS